MAAAVWNGLQMRGAWYSFARMCHETALSLRPPRGCTDTHCASRGGGFRACHMQRRQERDQCVGTHARGPASAFTRATRSASRNSVASTPQVGGRPLGEGTPLAPCRQVGLYQCTAAVAHLVMSLRSSHLVGDHLFFSHGSMDSMSRCAWTSDRVI